jgi:hypothetical protein
MEIHLEELSSRKKEQLNRLLKHFIKLDKSSANSKSSANG